MIEVGNEKDIIKSKTDGIIVITCLCYYCWGENYRLPLFHTPKYFIWINEAKKLSNEFTIGYTINPGLTV